MWGSQCSQTMLVGMKMLLNHLSYHDGLNTCIFTSSWNTTKKTGQEFSKVETHQDRVQKRRQQWTKDVNRILEVGKQVVAGRVDQRRLETQCQPEVISVVPLIPRKAQELEVPATSEDRVGWGWKQEVWCIYKALRHGLHSPGNWQALSLTPVGGGGGFFSGETKTEKLQTWGHWAHRGQS